MTVVQDDAPQTAAAPADSLPPEEQLLRSLEAITRAVRESEFRIAKDLSCQRGSVPVIGMLHRYGTLQVGEIAERLHVDVSVASRQVSHLVDEGLVERTVDGDDRRVRSVRLSPAGLVLAGRMKGVIKQRLHALFVDWSPDDLTDAARHLTHLAETVAAMAGRPAPDHP